MATQQATFQTGQRETVAMTVEKCASVQGRDGPQWELVVKWPWSTRVPDKVWLDKSDYPAEPALTAHTVTVERRGVKSNKDGPYDGKLAWMWNYKVVSFGAAPSAPPAAPGTPPAQEPRSPAPSAPPVPPAPTWEDRKNTSIERQKAVAEARAGAEFLLAQWFADTRSEFAGGGAREIQPLPTFLDTFEPKYTELVARLATKFYQSIHGRTEQQ